jgi:hypothetical protein
LFPWLSRNGTSINWSKPCDNFKTSFAIQPKMMKEVFLTFLLANLALSQEEFLNKSSEGKTVMYSTSGQAMTWINAVKVNSFKEL